ncbi:S8 family serine peptidase [Simiduia curdlanivorans]|uniref:S8 family serine peptidase n=1 Tax=Simiduia curdlanivorans TaxID=1492769 RepID=A0ABV8V0R8_9GAMM|nr:S8 family serine peptidase [Simiduia curdlanivorans]MDN3637680.1 S8 family serine peptidase [Simiduia curdlanivorans]
MKKDIMLKSHILLCLFVALLSACGGGGGGSTPSNQLPNAEFRITTSNFTVPATVAFNAQASSDSDGSIVNYAWTFGDGGSTTGAVVSHQYLETGSFTVELEVTDDDGGTDRYSLQVEIVANSPAVPVMLVTAPHFVVPATVHFDASDSTDADGSIASYHWNFDDGSIGQGPVVSHIFDTAGVYDVVLTLTDNRGALSTASRTLTVVTRDQAGTASISGIISAPAETAVDSDTNDPFNPYQPNNDFATAQAIANPVTVGGFVTDLSGTGNADNGDRFETIPDETDIYAVSLLQGQKILLEISDWAADVDLDLYLYDSAGAEVAYSIGESDVELVTVAASGDYFVQVFAYSGFSNYQLSIGVAASQVPAHAGNRSSEAPIIAGELLVEYKDAVVLGEAGIQRRAERLGMQVARALPGRAALNRFDLSRQTLSAMNAAIAQRMSSEQSERFQTLMKLKALSKDKSVQRAQPNYRYTAQAIPNDPDYIKQWHYPLINLPQAWDSSIGTGAIVAVLDTGVYLAHEDLTANLMAGYDFISETSNALDGNGIDANPDDPGDGGLSGSSSWHGTHVAGTIAAVTNNGKGLAGVAYGAKIMPLRVLGATGGSSYDIQQALYYAAGLPNDSGTVPTQRAHIANLSLGCQYCFSSAEAAVYQQVRDAGLIVVAASGNENSGEPGYPASYASVISVAATDRFDNRAPYSNFGQYVAVSAPGGAQQSGPVNGVLSTLVDQDQSSGSRRSAYAYYQGTSMATPHVAGVAALMVSLRPSLTPTEFEQAISSGSIVKDIGDAGRDDSFGYGRIDALKAVQYALLLEGDALPAALVVSPSAVNFSAIENVETVELDRIGVGTLRVVSATSSAAWLTVSAGAVDGDGLGDYLLSANRAGLDNGTYQAVVTFTADNAVSVSLNVSMVVGTNTSVLGAGHIYVLLLDESFAFFDQVNLFPDANGDYAYSFDHLPGTVAEPVKFYLVAGTDNDNDFELCDAGEVCGAYPTLGVLTPLNVTGVTTQVNFLVLMDGSISSNASATVAEGEPEAAANRPLLRRR